MNIVIKRVYDPAEAGDGYRVLVDRLWPRGIRKESLALDEWNRGLAPSPDLRKWFNHEPERFSEFAARYKDELGRSNAAQDLLMSVKGEDRLTLVYSAKDRLHNQAVVLKDYLQGLTAKE